MRLLPPWLALLTQSIIFFFGHAKRVSRSTSAGTAESRREVDALSVAQSLAAADVGTLNPVKAHSLLHLASSYIFGPFSIGGRARSHQPARAGVRRSGLINLFGVRSHAPRVDMNANNRFRTSQVTSLSNGDDDRGAGEVSWQDAFALKGELESVREELGPEHPETLKALNRYADAVEFLGWHSEAEPLRNQVLIQTRRMTVDALNNYASTLEALGRYQESVPLKKEILQLLKQNLGPDDPDTVDALRGYAFALSKIDKTYKALPMMKSVMTLTLQNFGEADPKTIAAMDEYADTLIALGSNSDAVPIKRKVLDLLRDNSEADHPDVLAAMNNYADVLLDLEEKDEALELKKEVLRITTANAGTAGYDYESTKALCRYAVALDKLGRWAEAEPLKKDVLYRMRELFGSEDEETIKALNNYAVTLDRLGRIGEAEPMMKEVFEVTSRLRGPDHPGTLRALDNWVNTLHLLGRGSEALQLKDYHAFTGKLAVAMFDFDQTLSVHHVFHTLGRYRSSIERRAEVLRGDKLPKGEIEAISPAGQVSRLVKEHDTYNATWAFGGAPRILALRSMLERLEARGVKMMVCTLGFPATVKKLLEEADLLKFFGWEGVPSVVGVGGATYKPYFSDYDLEAAKEFAVVEDPETILKSSKVDLLEKLLEKEGVRMRMKLPLTSGVLVEDDERAIDMAQRYAPDSEYDRVVSKGQLSTVFVKLKNGMRPDFEMQELLKMADA